MAIHRIYSGTTTSNMSELPSPISCKISREIIWSENTGRNSKGEMTGDIIDEKRTYDLAWGHLTSAEMQSIIDGLPAGYFYFYAGASNSPSSAKRYYRSSIEYDEAQVGSERFYKDVSVQVIEK